MRAVIQRVDEANVTVKGIEVGAIARGLVVLLAIKEGDGDSDLDFLVKKILNLRIFEDQQGKMNASLREVQGDLMVISQKHFCWQRWTLLWLCSTWRWQRNPLVWESV